MPFKLRKIKLKEISFVDKGANGGARVVICKRLEPKKEVKKMDPKLQELLDKLQEEDQKKLLALIESLKMPAQPVKTEAPVVTQPAEVAKRDDVPEDVKKRFEEIEKMNAQVAKEKAEIEKRLVAIEEEREIASFEKRAEEFDFVPGIQNKDIAKLMRHVEKRGDADMAKNFNAMLKSVNEVMKTSELFKKQGTNKADNGQESTESKITRLIKEERDTFEKRESKPLTDTQMRARIMEKYPEIRKALAEGN